MAYLSYVAKIREFATIHFFLLMAISSMTMIGATHRLSSGHSFPLDVIVGALLGTLFALFHVCL